MKGIICEIFFLYINAQECNFNPLMRVIKMVVINYIFTQYFIKLLALVPHSFIYDKIHQLHAAIQVNADVVKKFVQPIAQIL